MDQFDECDESAKGMPVPAIMNNLAEIYSELAKDPVMADPAMHVRQALIELQALCALARQVQLEDKEMEGATFVRSLKKRHTERNRRDRNNEGKAATDNNACLPPLASLQPHSFLKQ
jgi:hypothetical protein